MHLDNNTIDKVLELPAAGSIKFGIVEHAGTKENKYPVALSNNEELKRYLAMLDGKPVYKGIQAEWTDWMGCFSREALYQRCRYASLRWPTFTTTTITSSSLISKMIR